MWISEAWNRFWFGEVPLLRLAIFRIIVLLVTFYDSLEWKWLAFSDAAGNHYEFLSRSWNPIYAFELLGVGPAGPLTVRIVFTLLMVSIALGILGIFTRSACALVAILFAYWSGLLYSFEQAHHEKIALMFALFALPFSPAGKRLSIDALLSHLRNAVSNNNAASPPERHPFAAWPLRLTQVTIAIGYFFAGASKLLISGFEWMNGYTLQAQLLGSGEPWSEFLTHSVPLCRFMSGGLLFAQTTFPLVFLSPLLGWFYFPAVTAFHLIGWKTLTGSPYLTLWFMLLCFVPLEKVPEFTRRHVTTGSFMKRAGSTMLVIILCAGVLRLYFDVVPAVLTVFLLPLAVLLVLNLWSTSRVDVIFDGACSLCRRSIALLCALDWAKRLRPIDLGRWDEVRRLHPRLDPDRCLRDMHVVDGRGEVTAGFEAYRTLSWYLPPIVPFVPLFYLPPIAAIGRRLYRHIADRRKRTVCGDGSCAVHEAQRAGF